MNIIEAQFWSLCAVAILVVREWPRCRDLQVSLKIAHFAFVGLFSLLGMAGLCYLLLIIFHFQSFKAAFSENVPKALQSRTFEIFVVIFSVVGTALLFGALRLGCFRRWGRRVVLIFSLPYSVSYATVTVAMSGLAQLPNADKVVHYTTIILVCLSGLAILMYRSARFSNVGWYPPSIKGSPTPL